jgi:hypothetical protein
MRLTHWQKQKLSEYDPTWVLEDSLSNQNISEKLPDKPENNQSLI